MTPEHQAQMEELQRKAEANEIKRSITLSIKYDELPPYHKGLLADAVIRDLEGVVPPVANQQQQQGGAGTGIMGGNEVEGIGGEGGIGGELPPEIMEQLMDAMASASSGPSG